MSLKQDIQNSMKVAMKARKTLDLGAIRMVWSAIRKLEIDSKTDANDDEILGIIQKEIKSLNETISFLEKDNRTDAINEAKNKIAVLQKFMPEQLNEDAIRSEVLKIKSELNASGPQSMGKMMGKLVPLLKGRCDGKVLSKIVREVLQISMNYWKAFTFLANSTALISVLYLPPCVNTSHLFSETFLASIATTMH